MLNASTERGSGIARYQMPLKYAIGDKLPKDSDFNRELIALGLIKSGEIYGEDSDEDEGQRSIRTSVESETLNEMKREYKDLYCKRIMMDVYEAGTLQRVNV